MGDPRLTKRLLKISAKFAGNPGALCRGRLAGKVFDHAARAVPGLPSAVLLELEEWQALYCHHRSIYYRLNS